MNLAITTSCNRHCDFCFAPAREWIEPVSMELDLYRQALDLLIRNGIGQARLLGGEPSTHPRFLEMVDLALGCGLSVIVFTNGLISKRLRHALRERMSEDILLVVNVAYPFIGAQARAQLQTFQCLAQMCALGLTIDRPGVDLQFLLELQSEQSLRPLVRLGLAHPALGKGNRFLHPKKYPEVGRRVAVFAALAERQGVALEFDCGWVPCMFPSELPESLAAVRGELGVRCGPVLDLLPNATVIHCFALAADTRVRIRTEVPLTEMRSNFTRRLQYERAATVYPECDACTWRLQGRCAGGCLAMATRLRRVSGGCPPSLLLPSDELTGGLPGVGTLLSASTENAEVLR